MLSDPDPCPRTELERLQGAWRRLVGETLPALAASRPDWPIRLDHCFARVLLDNAYDAPWRTRISAPAWRHMAADDLRRALALGRAVAAGEADLPALNRRSLALRGKARER